VKYPSFSKGTTESYAMQRDYFPDHARPYDSSPFSPIAVFSRCFSSL
jgi:hypothetical protein